MYHNKKVIDHIILKKNFDFAENRFLVTLTPYSRSVLNFSIWNLYSLRYVRVTSLRITLQIEYKIFLSRDIGSWTYSSGPKKNQKNFLSPKIFRQEKLVENFFLRQCTNYSVSRLLALSEIFFIYLCRGGPPKKNFYLRKLFYLCVL